MGRIGAMFKADGAETNSRYSISEWWLEPNTKGPGAHSHPEDDIFYVIEGTMTILVGERWVDAPKGSFVLAPAGITHDFENRSSARAGVRTFRIRETSSNTCLASLSGSPTIPRRMLAPNKPMHRRRWADEFESDGISDDRQQ